MPSALLVANGSKRFSLTTSENPTPVSTTSILIVRSWISEVEIVNSPGVAVERRDADEGRELAAVEATEFRQFGDQGSGGHGANSRDGCQKILGVAPGG